MRPLSFLHSGRTLLWVSLVLLNAGLAAQSTIMRQAVFHPTTKNPESVLPMTSNQKTLAITADGNLWSLVRFIDGSYPTSGPFAANDASRFLFLYNSTDGGTSWKQVTKVRTTGSHYGSLVTDPDGHTLHVAWYAWNGKNTSGKGYSSVYYSTYDTWTSKWEGTADLELVKGISDRIQFYTPDIAVTEKGVVGVVFYTRYGKPAGWVGSGTSWQGGLVWKKGGKWSAPHQINQDGCGVRVEIHAQGNDFHMAYRVTTGSYGTSYRRFDTLTEKFAPEGEKPVVPNPSNPARNVSNLYANSDHSLAVQADGDIYLAYATGLSGSKPPGKIWYVYAKAGTYKFSTPFQIDDDKTMAGGNTNWYTFAIARVAGGMPVILYTKAEESYQNLYMRTLTPTGPVPPYNVPPVPLFKTTVNDTFRLIGGYRDQRNVTRMYGVFRDQAPKGPLTGGAAVFIGTPAGTAIFDVAGCNGSLPAIPRLTVTSLPTIGANLAFAMSDLPANQSGILFMGFTDQTLFKLLPLPFDFGPMGAPGCNLAVDLSMNLLFLANAQGNSTSTIPVPNDPLFIGLSLYWQGLVIAPGANVLNLITTNGLGTTLR